MAYKWELIIKNRLLKKRGSHFILCSDSQILYFKRLQQSGLALQYSKVNKFKQINKSYLNVDAALINYCIFIPKFMKMI